jgi:hypothetical protein
MSSEIYKTGKAGNILVAAAVVAITKWSGKLTKEYANATDSTGFDPTNQQLWKKQAAGSIQLEGSIEGFFDFNADSSSVLAAVLGDVALQTVLNYDETTPFATGPMNFMDFDSGIDVEGGTTVGFTTGFKSYGPCVMLG